MITHLYPVHIPRLVLENITPVLLLHYDGIANYRKMQLYSASIPGSNNVDLRSESVKSLYRLKRQLIKSIPGLWEAYEFNRISRNRWIELEASLVAPNSKVLDIGAGSAPYRRLFRNCIYRTHDFGQLKPEQLQGRSGYAPIDLVSDIASIPAESGSMDVILCTEVIEHVPEPIRAVHEMGRLLSPGGRLLLSAPMRSGLHQEPFHFYGGYTPYWYQRHLSEAGFRDIEVIPVGGLLKAYAEEGIRVMMQFSPFSQMSKFKKIALFPLWLIMLPWLALICPLLFSFLDRFVSNKAFAVGHHVRATKA